MFNNWSKFGMAAALVVLAAGCGGDQTDEAVLPNDSDNSGEVEKLGAVLQDPLNGEGGTFSFTYGEESVTTEWGGAAYRVFPGGLRSKLLIMCNPQNGEELPILRIVISSERVSFEEFIDAPIEGKFVLKFDKSKGSGDKGNGTLTITSADSQFLEGEFTAEMDSEKTLQGSFRVKINLRE